MTRRYKIDARIDRVSAERAGTANTDGYSVHDYFCTDLDGVYATREQAQEVAEAGYRGPDVDGVGCTWEIIRGNSMNKHVWFDDYSGNWYGYVSIDGHICQGPLPATGGIISDPDKLTLENKLDAFTRAYISQEGIYSE